MLFKKRADYVVFPGITGLGNDGFYAQTFRAEVTREFPIEAIYLKLSINLTVATSVTFVDTAAVAGSGWFAAIKRVTIQVADGARTRNVVDASGPQLIEYARNIMAGADSNYNSNRFQAAVNTINLYVPIFFAHPQVSDPVSSMFLLPAPRFNQNIVVTVQTDAKANVVTGTNTETLNDLSLVVHRREVNLPDWQYFDTELSEVSYSLSATGQQAFELGVPGAYTGIQLLTRSSALLRNNPFTALGENRLQYLGNVVRRFRIEDIQAENEWSIPGTTEATAATPNPGVYYLDFLTDRVGESVDEVGSVLETNFLAATGARMQLLMNIGSSGGTMSVLSHRIFGDISGLKMKSVGAAPAPGK